MKNFQQNLLIALALALCGLCVWQWYVQTVQRGEIGGLNHEVFDRSVAFRDSTNSVATLNQQITVMDARITELKEAARTNDQFVLSQRREIVRLHTTSEALTNEIAEYKQAVDALQKKLRQAYDGITNQNASLKELAAQRDEFVKKYNDSVKDRNDIVAKYNELAAQVQKLQSLGGK